MTKTQSDVQLAEKPNRCGGCTLCCTLFEVPELNKKAMQDCIHCDVNVGCKIWQNRPQVCRNFQCAYYQDDKSPIALRPDKCGVVFEKIKDMLFFGTLHPDYKISELIQNQIYFFNKEGFSVVIRDVKNNKMLFTLAEGHTKSMIQGLIDDFVKENAAWQRTALI